MSKIIVSGIRLALEAENGEALVAACKRLGISGAAGREWRVCRASFDLRHGKPERVLSVEIELEGDEALLPPNSPDIKAATPVNMPRPCGNCKPTGPPVVIGLGPAGLFAALVLAENGYRPHVVERGGPIPDRDAAVSAFFGSGDLNPDSNIQYGEGGAGAYSDGKLTTRINDPRCALALWLLERHGAPGDALVPAKPHIGTDLLKGIVVSMRQRIIALGGTVDFYTRAVGFISNGGALIGVKTSRGEIPCDTAVLAIGHSARDTFKALAPVLKMESKAFSVGVRIEHLQQDIDRGLYGKYAGHPALPPGEYSLSHKLQDRGCYSFCMCPGGYVVAASSEEGGVVTNGMSLHARGGINANSAICVGVGAGDLDYGLFAGMELQRKLEHAAFWAGGGGYAAPVQLLGDFLEGRASHGFSRVQPSYPRGHRSADLNRILPGFVSKGIAHSIGRFGQKLRGFDSPDAVLTGVETRTSSPIRILRGENMESPSLAGLLPCGEGAGYAGGIISAAVDGIRAAEQIMSRLKPVL